MNKFFKTAKLETYIYLLIFGFTGFIFFKFFYPLLKRALGTEELIKEDKNEEQHLRDIDTELEFYKKNILIHIQYLIILILLMEFIIQLV